MAPNTGVVLRLMFSGNIRNPALPNYRRDANRGGRMAIWSGEALLDEDGADT